MSHRLPYIKKFTEDNTITLRHLNVGETFMCGDELYQVIKYKADDVFVHLETGEAMGIDHGTAVIPVDIQITIHLDLDLDLDPK